MDNSNSMLQIDIFILLAQLINFWILYYVFKTFIADTISEKMKERRQQLEKLKKADEHYDEKMFLAEKKGKEIEENARKTSRNLMKESEILAKAQAKAIQEKAHAEALAILDGGRREIEKERKTMLTQMKSHIIDISFKLNEKMFGKWKTSKEFLEAEFAKMK